MNKLYKYFAGTMVSLAFVFCIFNTAGAAISLQEVTTVDVTPSGFGVIWQSSETGTPGIAVFSDLAGTDDITDEFEVTLFPLRGGDPAVSDEYQQDVEMTALRGRSKSLGLMNIAVHGCIPGTTYYYRIYTEGGSETVSWPVGSTVPVTTADENSFISDSKQLMVVLRGGEGLDVSGWIVTAAGGTTVSPVSAVVGDGAGPDTAYLNLGNLFDGDGSNWTPQGLNDVYLRVLGPLPGVIAETVNINFPGNFSVSNLYTVEIVADVSDNIPPDADAGDDRMVVSGTEAVLDGSASNDPDSGPQGLSYSWEILSVPAGSYITDNDLTGADTAFPVFTPDVQGEYLVRLTVSDGQYSDVDNMAVTAVQEYSVSGSGMNYPEPGFSATLSLDIKDLASGTGWLNYYYSRLRLAFESTLINGISVSGNTAVITGEGTVNGAAGYEFRATITDNDPDTMGIVIYSADGSVYRDMGAEVLSYGDFIFGTDVPIYKVSGSGMNYPEPNFSASLTLDVRESSLGESWLKYYFTKLRLAFDSTLITGIYVTGDTVIITGEGTLNGVSGYTFTLTIINGEPDMMGIVIYNPDGTVYFDSDPVAITSGNFNLEIDLPVQYTLTSNMTPSGAGSLDPDCAEGCEYVSDTLVTLTAAEKSGSTFVGWTGCDYQTNNVCTMTMDSDNNVTALFEETCSNDPVSIGTVYYPTLQAAYDNAENGDTIRVRAVVFPVGLTAGRDIAVTLQGGYDCDYSNITGYSIVNGDMIINNGIVTIDKFIME